MSVYIDGISVLSHRIDNETPYEFPSEIPSAKLRRNSRYNKLACAAADFALKDCAPFDSVDKHRIGTIISTGCGAAEYFSDFADSVVRGDPAACSPATFSGSVPNSCVGQICILNGFKGVSTVLAGGDPLEYSALLLKTDRADMIVTGSVEEYFKPLYDSIVSFDAAKGAELAEGAAMLIMRSERTEKTFCEVCANAGISLGANPYIHRLEGVSERIAGVLRKHTVPDIIFTAANGTYFDEMEDTAIKQVFPDTAVYEPKKEYGESLGCGFALSTAFAAEAIRDGKYGAVLVAGVDMVGNYCTVMLKAVGQC